MAYYAIDKTLTINDLRFHYRDWNGHGWPTLLLHGISSTSHIWDLVAPLLAEEARTVALDLRGHGQSDKPDSDYSFESIAADVLGLFAELPYERPVLVGQSWGANVALHLAANHPDRIGGLIMVDGGIVDLGKSTSWEETQAAHTPPNIDGQSADAFREMLVTRTPQGLLSPAVEAAIMANFEIDTENRIHRRLPVKYHLRILKALWEQRLEPLYDKLTCPTLVLPVRWEGRDDPDQLAQKTRGAELAEKTIADVEVVWLEKSIHDVPLQRPHRVAEEIRRFIKEQL